ncbi:hypothetical protein FH972_008543 [Carpinus fangiana]|uniref:tRNA-binding domain-containing protein n=1 Tax=Carpinus fangiana TaxID=176857 RepID=A0A5N6QZX5_9ROSI|nr:hypothetical protein FH972_008543 [Carpinus fangiana]
MAVMPLPTNTIASSANVLKAGGAQLLWSFSKCSRLQPHPRPLAFHSLPLFSADNIRRRRRSVRWLPSFCTEAATPVSVAAGADNNVEDDGEKKMRMIKEAADTLDIRVGRVLRAWRHEEADSLYVEEVDVGEPETRIICSGLVNYVPLHHLQDRNVVVLANLKPRNMRGVKSCGMLMAASDASHENVELLVPPEGSLTGERIWFGSENEKESQPAAATPNQIQKKKIWELVQPHLKTDASCTAMLGVHVMRTSAGVVVSTSLKNANIS